MATVVQANLANVDVMQGQPGQARFRYEQAVAQHRAMGQLVDVVQMLGCEVKVLLMLKDSDTARDLLEQALMTTCDFGAMGRLTQAGAMLAQGKKTYESICGTCHGADGLGKFNQAPALAGSDWVTAKGHNRLAYVPLLGLNGPITINGQQMSFPTGMAAMGAVLSDADLAAVLTYIRSSWGNKAAEVTADDIKAIRASMKTKMPPLTYEQLMALPE